MKKTAFVAALALAATSAFATPAVAQDKGNATDTVEFCDAFGNDNTGAGLPTKGSCISFFRTDDAVALCKQLKDFGNLEAVGFRSQGECIKFFSQFF